jgi:exonuclease III
MRLVNFNIEWMNDWFMGGNKVAFRQDNPRRGIENVDALAKRVASLILSVDPDVLTIEEGPSDIREMQLFVSTYLCANNMPGYDILGGIDGKSQKIYALVKKNGRLANAQLVKDLETNKLKGEWECDIDGNGIAEPYKFTRLPVVIEADLANHRKCRIIAMHTKSNYVQNGEKLWKNPATKQQFINIALENRRRISTEAMRVRMYLDILISVDPNANIIITGDLNDGPGLDYFEMRYLTHNVIDIILGSTFAHELLFRHSFIDKVNPSDRYTAEFYDYVDKKNKKLLLDHIAVSPALVSSIISSGILHNEYDAAMDQNAGSERQKRASDHRPVYVDIR